MLYCLPMQSVSKVKSISSASWQAELAQGVKSAHELLGLLELNAQQVALSAPSEIEFPTRVPRGFVARMRKGDPRDPLLLQVLATPQEMLPSEGFSVDPLAEAQHNPVPGLLHKYHGRVLLIAATACAINCRYCFRRHFAYADNQLNSAALARICDYIRHDTSISEVILSGGDPFLLSNRRLGLICEQLSSIPHLQSLRIHSRIPIVLPERIEPGLLDALHEFKGNKIIVLHANHAQEIDDAVHQALYALRTQGISLLNQAVLLQGVNAEASQLMALNKTLFKSGVLPYYLHKLDAVQGAAHFAVADESAVAIMAELKAKLPGYLVPRFVCEEPGASSKTTLL